MKTYHLLIDYENVQPKSFVKLKSLPCKLYIFLGPQQSCLQASFVEEVQQFGNNAQYIRVGEAGANSLDFHLTFKLGQLVQSASPQDEFCIISKDKGYDVLFSHTKTLGFNVCRCKSVESLPVFRKQVNPSKTPAVQKSRLDQVIQSLRSRGKSRPKSVKALLNTVTSQFGKNLSETEVNVLLNELRKAGKISVNEQKVEYHL